ncbi:cyclase family protein [Actinomycetota bacterium]
MKIIDISGPVYTGMWNYPEPLGSKLGAFSLEKLEFEFGGQKYFVDTFKGMKAQTGTHIETPGRYLEGNDYKVSDIHIKDLFLREAYVFNIPYKDLKEKDGKKYIDLDDLKQAQKEEIKENSGILIGTGYGSSNWDKKDFFERSWFFKKEAMQYLISLKPFLLGTDSGEWENTKNPEGIFKMFFPANILILAPCINIEKVSRFKANITIFPFNVEGSYISPVRAVITEQ